MRSGGRPRWLFRLFREPVNSLTHLVGVVLGVVALVILVGLAQGDPWRLASFSVYGSSLILLYGASTLLHGLHVDGAGRRLLRTLDHGAIFVLIAGTYTPVVLLALRPERPGWAWSLFGVVWLLALLGILFKVVWLQAPRWLSTGLYLLLGWLALIAVGPLVRALPPAGMGWMLAGGVIYSLGAVVYARRRPDPAPPWFGYHELWHLLVLAGSLCHVLMMLTLALPA